MSITNGKELGIDLGERWLVASDYRPTARPHPTGDNGVLRAFVR